MAVGKKSFVAYSDWKSTFDELPNEEAGMLIKHIFAYVNDENPTSDSVLIKAVFANIKTTLKRDLQRWENQLNQRSEAGKKSADKRASTKFNERSTSVENIKRNSTDNVNVSDTDNVTVTNFFKINGQVFKLKVSDYFLQNFGIFFGGWETQNKTANTALIFSQMDTEYNGYDFTNQNHIQNTFKNLAKKAGAPSKIDAVLSVAEQQKQDLQQKYAGQ